MDIASGMDYLHSLGVLHGMSWPFSIIQEDPVKLQDTYKGAQCKVYASRTADSLMTQHGYQSQLIGGYWCRRCEGRKCAAEDDSTLSI